MVNINNAQNLKIVSFVEKNSPFLQYEYGGLIIGSFAIDSTTIYFNNIEKMYSTFVWNYKEPLSKTNPKIIIKYSSENIKKINNLLVNAALDIYNLDTEEKTMVFKNDKEFNPNDDRKSRYLTIKKRSSVEEFEDWIIYTLTDSSIYYFKCYDPLHPEYTFHRYNIYIHKIEDINLDNLSKNISDYAYINDIFINNNKLYYSTTSKRMSDFGDVSTIVICWNLTEDKKNTELTLSDSWQGERILGMDKWGDILLFSKNSSENYFTILSPDLEVIKNVEMEPILNKMDFMNNNKYDPGYYDDPYMLVSLNEDQQLFVIVLTEKGMYLLQYNYLPLLKDYYSGKSKNELRILRNKIYARHGRTFKSKDLNDYFSRQSLYKPNSAYSESLLTDFDKECVDFIVDIEKTKK